ARTALDASARGHTVRVEMAPRASAATVTLFGVPLPFVDLDVAAFGVTSERPEDLAFDLRARAEGAGVHVVGAVTQAFTPLPGLDVTIEVDRAGKALHDLVAGLLPDLDVGGEAAKGHVRLHGPLTQLIVDGEVEGVDAALAEASVRATSARGKVHVQ